MPRRNVRAKTTRRHHRRPEVQQLTPYRKPVKPRVTLSNVVRPVGMCGTKLKFDTEENAAIALVQARASHAGSGRIEKRYYPCDRCKGYHLTSREQWVEREEPNV